MQEASSESAQLALTTQEGDVVVRTDENKSYVHNGGSANSMADFTLLRTPTDTVLSVNGNTGAITAAQIATAVEAASDSNTFTDADHTKLDGIAASANNYVHPNHSGDVTSSADGATTIADNAVTLDKMAGLARGKIIYGNSSGDPAALAIGSANQVLTSDGTDVSWAAAAGGGSEVSATATGAITAEKAVCVKSDGTFEQIVATASVNNPATKGSTTYRMHDTMPYDSFPDSATEPDNGFAVLSFVAESGNQGYYKLGKVNASTGAIDWYRTAWGNPWYTTTTTAYTRVTYGKDSNGDTVFLFSCINNGNEVVCRGGRVESASQDENGTLAYNITFGTASAVVGTAEPYEVVFNDADDKFYLCMSWTGSGGTNDRQYVRPISIASSDLAITAGTQVGGGNSGSGGTPVTAVIDPSTKNIFTFAQKSDDIKLIVYTWGGSSYTEGTMVDAVTGILDYEYADCYKHISAVFDSANSKIVLCYSHSDEDGRVIVGDVSGASVTWGTPVEYQNADTMGVTLAFDSSLNRIFIAARNKGASDNAYIYNGITSGSGASSTITFTASNETVSADTSEYYTAAYEPTSGLVLFGYAEDDNSDRGKVVTFKLGTTTTNATDENFIGFAKDTVSNGASSTVKVVGNTTTQSGLTPGQKYYLQKDGTISLTPAGSSTGLASTVAGIALSSTSLLIKG